MKSPRLLLERLGLVLITVLALGAPLALGFFSYLALGDGLDVNAGNPLRAGRIWFVRENRRFTALAVSGNIPAAPASNEPNVQCARTAFTALRWSPAFSIERTLGACTCYAPVEGALRQSRTQCAPDADVSTNSSAP